MRIVPFKEEHIDALVAGLRPIDAEVAERRGGIPALVDRLKTMMGYACMFTFLTSGGNVAAVFCITSKWTGVADIWAYTTNHVEANRIGFYRASRRGVDNIAESLNLHRVEAVVWDGYERSAKWLEHIGFKREAVLEKYGPDKESAIIMGKVY